MFRKFLFLGLVLCFSATAVDTPNALMRTADGIGVNNFEIMVSPQVVFEPNGAYLNAEARYQPAEELDVGFGFGAGQVGYNFGAFVNWHVFPDLEGQPAFSVLGGLHYNRIEELESDVASPFFVLRAAAIFSETFRLGWGIVTPYGGGVVAPSFRLSEADNQISLRAAMGAQVALDQVPGMRVMMEFGMGIHNSPHQLAVGVSYPLGGLGAS